MARYLKDPDAVLDYKVDYSSWLADGETISTATVTVDAGITKDSSSVTDSNTSVTAWLSGGTAGDNYKVTYHITTSDGREDDRTIVIKVLER